MQALKACRDKSSVEEGMSRVEAVLTEEDLRRAMAENTDYQNVWIEYASLVKDSKKVYEFMEANQIALTEPCFYISYALYFEKFERDFKLAEEVYTRAI
jgi:Mad3/BUB1 homology region 1